MHQYRSARTNRRLYFLADNNKGGFMHVSYKPQLSATSYRDLTDQIQFQSQEGKIWFGEQRMLLMHLSAMAAFRREVVNSMGIERAKGFFMRLGYQSGIKDAELARKLRPDASDIEIFLAGPQLHSVKGMVKVVPIEIDLDHASAIQAVLGDASEALVVETAEEALEDLQRGGFDDE